MSPSSEHGGRAAGAAAAIADLARAGLQETGPTVDPEQRNAAFEIFRTAEKLMRALNTYEHDHPYLLGFLEEFERQIAEYAAQYEDLLVGLRPTSVTLEGEIVYTAERVTENMWFPLFGDGIRQLSFSSDCTREDLLSFFEILHRAGELKDKEDIGEDDSVTMLWEADLDGISFVAVSHLMEGREESNPSLATVKQMINLSMMKELTGAALAGDAYASGEISKRMHTISLSAADLMFLRSENLGALDEMPMSTREVSGRLFELDPEAVEEFVQRCGAEPKLIERYLNALLAALAHVMVARDAKLIVTRMRVFLEAIITDGRFRRAAHLLATTTATIEQRLAQDPEPKLTEALQQPLVTETAAQKIVLALAEASDPDVVKDLFGLVQAVPLEATPEVVKLLYHIPQRELRRRICDLLAHAGLVVLDTASAVVEHWEEEQALDLLYLMQRVGHEPGLRALEGVSASHPLPRVRTAALLAYLEAADSQHAAARARRMLSDKDVLLRRTAVEYLMSAQYVGSHDWIKSRIDMQEFTDLEFSEKKHLFIAYATIGGERTVEWLLERLNQRNLFGKSSIDHDRAAAALALARLHVEEARAPIERILGGKLTRSLVKEACTEALKILDAPPQPSAARPRAANAPAIQPVRPAPAAAKSATELRSPPRMPRMPGEAERELAAESPTPRIEREDDEGRPTVKGHAPSPEGAMPLITFRSSPAPAPSSPAPPPAAPARATQPAAPQRPTDGLDLPPDEPLELVSTTHAGADLEAVSGRSTQPLAAAPPAPRAAPSRERAAPKPRSTPTIPNVSPPVASTQSTEPMATKTGALRFGLAPNGTLPLDLPPLVGEHFGAPPPPMPAPAATPPTSTDRRPPPPRAGGDVNALLQSYMDPSEADGDD